MAKSKFFRVAVEGDTIDGRKIERQWLEQISANYDQNTYGARVWIEHMRGMLPESSFRAYGDVLAVKTEEVDIAGEKKLALFAQIDATDDLIEINRNRQKIYTSIEVDTDFQNSGQAYLVGLAVTDSPASIGTEKLSFSSMVAKFGENAEKDYFSQALETHIEFEELWKFSGILKRFNEMIIGKYEEQNEVNNQAFGDIHNALEQALTVFNAQQETIAQMQQQFAAMQQQLNSLQAEFNAQPQIINPTRPEQTGGDASFIY